MVIKTISKKTKLNKIENSIRLFTEAKSLMPGGVNSPVRAFKNINGNPIFFEKANGAYLYDADGNEYIDFIGSWGPMIMGHSHPNIVNAIQKQAQLGTSYGLYYNCCKIIFNRVKYLSKSVYIIIGTRNGKLCQLLWNTGRIWQSKCRYP